MIEIKRKKILFGIIRAIAITILASYCFVLQGFLPLYSQTTPTCNSAVITCASGNPVCKSGLSGFAECRSLPGFGFTPGCNTTIAFFPDDVICGSSSSNSSTTPEIKPTCSGGMAICSNGLAAKCKGDEFTIRCIYGVPDCCKIERKFLSCMPSLLFCPQLKDENRFSLINLQTTSSPRFPEVVELPLIIDETSSATVFAYRGSNPSFEVKLPANSVDFKIDSIDIKDSNGTISNNIPFTVTSVSNKNDIKILSIVLPDSTAGGVLTYALNLNNGTSLAGNIHVIDFLFASNPKHTEKTIQNPSIERIEVTRDNESISLLVRGKNFVGRTIYLEEDNKLKYIENDPKNPHSFVTIFPSTLNPQMLERVVSKDKTQIKIKFKLSQEIGVKTNAILVISTPRGIASKSFVIK